MRFNLLRFTAAALLTAGCAFSAGAAAVPNTQAVPAQAFNVVVLTPGARQEHLTAGSPDTQSADETSHGAQPLPNCTGKPLTLGLLAAHPHGR